MTRARPIYMLAASLLLLATLARAVVPQGFMPTAEDGLARIEICTTSGFADIFVPEGDAPQIPSDHAEQGDHCPFAPAFAQAVLAAAFALLAPAPPAALPACGVSTLHTFPCSKPYFSQGPPSLRN